MAEQQIVNDDMKQKSDNTDPRALRLFVPGRICLFGEHSDWAGSYRKLDKTLKKGRCIVCGTNQGIYANVCAHPNKLICISQNEKGTALNNRFECAMDLDALLECGRSGGTYSYVCGVAYQMLKKHRIGGLIINNYRTTLPLKKGLSSSAAICVLTARAFNKIYSLKLTVEGEMEYAYLGERTTPSKCGRMDQCAAYGSRPVSMEFDEDSVTSKELQFGGNCSLYLVIVDLNKSKDTKTILSDLNACYAVDDVETSVGLNVKRLLGDINLDITDRAIAAIKTGDTATVGQLMAEAQRYFKEYALPASPAQLSSPWLYKLLSFEQLQPFIYGGKGVGSQGDGSAQLLCKSEKDQQTVCDLIEKEFGASEGMQCLKLVIGGYQRVKKCVIPTANYGPLLFPSSKTVSTALFPLIDGKDGLLKPAILIIVEEVIEAGIDEIYIIVSPHDLASFRHLFHGKMHAQLVASLSPELQTYSEKILFMGRKIRFIVQESPEGLAHAVFCARSHIDNSEKFLLLLGDHIYKSNNAINTSCIQQLLDYYAKTGVNCVGLKITPEKEIRHFGTVQGNWIDYNDKQSLYVQQIVEKPSVEYAQKYMQCDGLSNTQFLTMFGLYILDGSIMQLISHNIDHKPPIRHVGKFCLSPCLQKLRNEQEMHGLIIDGKRFDIGSNPLQYVYAINNYHLHDTRRNSLRLLNDIDDLLKYAQ